MTVTETRIRPTQDMGKVAEADVTLDYELVIRNLSIRQNAHGVLFVDFPHWKRYDGAHTEIVYPIVPYIRHIIAHFILKDYQRILETVGG
jgi:DNA-binding cell septation regulator SpoVG